MQVDREQWDLEYQQVVPHLQIRVAAEARDFRAHLEAAAEQMQRVFPDDDLQHRSLDNKTPVSAESALGLRLTWGQTRKNLQHTQNEIADHLTKIATREDLLNDQFAAQTAEYQNQKQRHTKQQVVPQSLTDQHSFLCMLECLLSDSILYDRLPQEVHTNDGDSCRSWLFNSNTRTQTKEKENCRIKLHNLCTLTCIKAMHASIGRLMVGILSVLMGLSVSYLAIEVLSIILHAIN